jgi:hypothetical protein
MTSVRLHCARIFVTYNAILALPIFISAFRQERERCWQRSSLTVRKSSDRIVPVPALNGFQGVRGIAAFGLNFDVWGEWLNSRRGPGRYIPAIRWLGGLLDLGGRMDNLENRNLLLLPRIEPPIFWKCADCFNISQFLSAAPSGKEKNTEVYYGYTYLIIT